MNLELLKVFYHVATAGSIKGAESPLGIGSSFISKKIKSLEIDLKAKLFTRHRRGLILTPQGKALFSHALKIEAILDDLRFEFKEDSPIKDSIRILTTTGLTSFNALEIVEAFYKKHPKAYVSINCLAPPLSLKNHPADLAISPDPCREEGVINEKILKQKNYCFASPEYIENHGMPEKPEDLIKHKLISFRHEHGSLVNNSDMHVALALEYDPAYRPSLYINSYTPYFDACVRGLGIIYLPGEHPYVERFKLIKVLPNFMLETSVYLSYQQNMLHSRLVQLFRKTVRGLK